jgi:hypothetical protein
MFVLSRNASRKMTNRGGRTRRSHFRNNFFSASGSMFVPGVSLTTSSFSIEEYDLGIASAIVDQVDYLTSMFILGANGRCIEG